MKLDTSLAKKAMYVAIGAPVVAGKKVRAYTEKLTSYGSKVVEEAQEQLDEFAGEGQKVTEQLRRRNVVEELQHRVDLEKVQDRVEKLRDQLENALASWRESFTPEVAQAAKPAPKPAAAKPAAAKKTVAKKTTAAKKPAAKKTTAKPAAKKPAARKTTTAAKKTTAKKTTASKSSSRSTAKAASK